MKQFWCKILMVIALFTVETGFAQYPSVDMSTISENTKTEIYNFVQQAFMTACTEEKFSKLPSKITTSRFRKRFTEEKVSSRCQWFVERYGVIEEMSLTQVIEKNNYRIFRYKIKRSMADWYSEIRVFLNTKGKIDILGLKGYWSDVFYDYKEHPKVSKVDPSQLNQSILKKNDEFAFRSYHKCEPSKLYIVDSTNAIYRSIRESWKNKMMVECDSIKRKNGDFNEVEFVESLTDSVSNKIYRYKVKFNKLDQASEIRIYSSLSDKYTGIFVVDVWYDKYLNMNKAIEKSKNDLGIN